MNSAQGVFPTHFSAASLDALKWLAVLLMVIDHINKFVFAEAVPVMFALGRVAMPLFAFVLGCRLAQPESLKNGIYQRVFVRLVVFGVLALVPHTVLNKLLWGWWPVNILFTLAVSVLVAWLLDKGGPTQVIGACLLFLFGGALVEFWWPALAICLSVWAYFRTPSLVYVAGFVVSLLALYLINGNFWALLALPLIAAARVWRWPLPRMKWFFYAFYPLHFMAIWVYLHLATP